MIIKWGGTTGCLAGNFLVTAENDQERAILRLFVHWPEEAKGDWRFMIQNYGCSTLVDGVTSFLFGWSKAHEDNK